MRAGASQASHGDAAWWPRVRARDPRRSGQAEPRSRSRSRASGTARSDLFAGSGAAGIEALSRGARIAVFVERKARSRSTSSATCELRAYRARARIATIDAPLRLSGLAAPVPGDDAQGPLDAILVDPPYDEPQLVDRSLEAIAAAGPDGILAGSGVVVAKHWKTELPARIRLLRSSRVEHFGETMLTFYRWSEPVEGEEVDEGCALPGLVRPGDQRPSRRPPASARGLRPGGRRGPREPRKSPLLPVETRVVVLETAIRDAGFDAEIATVTTFDGLTVEAARANGARWLVRGLRAISDFEAEASSRPTTGRSPRTSTRSSS